MWFERVTGFREQDAESVRSQLVVDGEIMTSTTNGRSMRCGRLEIASLYELRNRIRNAKLASGGITLTEVVANVQHLHCMKENESAIFQVASQFNLLEMISPAVGPEEGVDIYENDLTQGPACAIACGAGTIYRNYFVELAGQVGQTSECQVDCLADLGERLGNENNSHWVMRNGYVLPTEAGLEAVCHRIRESSERERERLRGLLKCGCQWGTEVTIADTPLCVSQVYCSALPVAYSTYAASKWTEFACLILEAAYEATLCAAVLNLVENGSNKVFLTLLGGGAFGNQASWIIAAIERAVSLFADAPLEVSIVSYGQSKPMVSELAARYSR